jgi:hypothetical protein
MLNQACLERPHKKIERLVWVIWVEDEDGFDGEGGPSSISPRKKPKKGKDNITVGLFHSTKYQKIMG